MIAGRYKLKCGWVDGKHCIVFKTRPPIHWDNELQIWKFGTMSQMMEKQATGKEVCVVCTNGSVKIHLVFQDGPPPPGSHFFYLPWPDATLEQEDCQEGHDACS